MYFEKLVYAETHLPYHEIEQTRSLRQYSGLYSVATKYHGELIFLMHKKNNQSSILIETKRYKLSSLSKERS